MLVHIICKSIKPKYKYTVFICNEQHEILNKIHFGISGYGDYTMHHDKKLKYNYVTSHVSKFWNNTYMREFWEKNILWNKKTLLGSINSTTRKFKILIVPYKLFS